MSGPTELELKRAILYFRELAATAAAAVMDPPVVVLEGLNILAGLKAVSWSDRVERGVFHLRLEADMRMSFGLGVVRLDRSWSWATVCDILIEPKDFAKIEVERMLSELAGCRIELS